VQQDGTNLNSYMFAIGTGRRFVTPIRFYLAPGQWHWVELAVAHDGVRAYVDGVLVEHSSAGVDELENSALPLMVSNWIGGDRSFSGRVAAIRIDRGVRVPERFDGDRWQKAVKELDANAL
jgi:hypothetical protein